MERQTLKMVQRYSAWVLALSVVATGCGKGNTTRGASLPVPTLNAAPPIYTHNPNLGLAGTRPEGTDVVAVYANGSEVILAKAAGSSSKWNGVLPLTSGQNNFQLLARRDTGESPKTSVYSTLLVGLQTPTLNNVLIDGVAYFYMGDNPPTTIQGPLSGTKSPDGNLELTYNGVTAVAAGIDNNAAWNANVLVSHGLANASIDSKDGAGDVSGALNFGVRGTWQPGPHIDPSSYTADTNRIQQTLYGTKPANTVLFFILNGAAAVQVTANSNTLAQQATTWSYTFPLSEGDNVAAVYVTGQSDSLPSAPDVARIHLATKVAQPIFVPPLANPLPATSDASITLSGTLGPNAYVCVSHSPWNGDPNNPPRCFATSPNPTGPNGGSFTIVVPLDTPASNPNLVDGTNNLYITAIDSAGNVSPEVDTSIYRVSPPTVTNVSITTANSNNFTMTFDAGPDASDSNTMTIGTAAASIASVQVCAPDPTHCKNLPVDANGMYTYSDPNALANQQNGGSYQITITVTDTVGGTHTYSQYYPYTTGAPIWLSRDGNGTNFTPTNYTATHPADYSRSVVDAAGNVYIVWEDNCAQLGSTACKVAINASGQIGPDVFYVKRSVTGGFGPVQLISGDANGTTLDGISHRPALTLDASGTLHIVWSDNGGYCRSGGGSTNYCIVHRTVSPAGVLSAIDNVGAPSAVDDVNPSVAADTGAGVVHVSYTHQGAPYSINYRQLVGTAWSTALTLTEAASYQKPAFSAVTAGPGGSARVVWQDCTAADPNNGQNYCAPTGGGAPVTDVFLQTVTNATTLGALTLVTNSPRGVGGTAREAAVLVSPVDSSTYVFWTDTSGLGSGSGRAQALNILYRVYPAGSGAPGGFNLLSDDNNESGASQVSVSANSSSIAAVWVARAFNTGTQTAGLSSLYGKVIGDSVTPLHLPVGSPVGDTSPSVSLDANNVLQATWSNDGNPDVGIVNTNQDNMTYYNAFSGL